MLFLLLRPLQSRQNMNSNFDNSWSRGARELKKITMKNEPRFANIKDRAIQTGELKV